MDIDLLRTFLEVQQTRHFGRAAENLFLTQAAVSARIKQLESIVGSPVFTRYRNNLQLTETGRRLIPHAQAIAIAWDRAKQEVAVDQRSDVVLGIGAIAGLWDLFLQSVLNDSYRQDNGVVWRAEAHSPDILNRRLLDRTLDVAFQYEGSKHSDIRSSLVHEVDLVMVTTPAISGSAEEALARYVAIDWGASFNIQFAKNYGNVPVILHTTMARIALNFLESNEGTAYLPYQLVADQVNERFRVVEDAPKISRRIFAAYHVENRYEAQLQAFIRLAENAFTSEKEESA